MQLAVIGVGYVGLTYAVCLAELGFKVVGVDVDEEKVELLNNGIATIHEEGLEGLLKKHVNKTLTFTTRYNVLEHANVIFLCLPTPQDKNGKADLKYLFQSVESMKPYLKGYKVIVVKSTVPVGTAKRIKEMLRDFQVSVVSNPEFLREGSAINDFFNPSRIVIGYEDERAKNILLKVYERFVKNNVPFVFCNNETAELIKYASNTFLACRISLINELARYCEKVNADIKTVARALGLDERIGKHFLNAGLGYGGSCFPKDVKALINQFESAEVEARIIKSIDEVNETQVEWFLEKIEKTLGISNKTFAVLGLAFKPRTDDIRESRGIKLVSLLKERNARIKAFDFIDKARERASKLGIECYDDIYEAVRDADAIIIATEYEEFRNLDWKRIKSLMKGNLIFDGRNVLDKGIEKLGFVYKGVGR